MFVRVRIINETQTAAGLAFGSSYGTYPIVFCLGRVLERPVPRPGEPGDADLRHQEGELHLL
jgi:hypothetical protein